jgi:methyl-accepting chemotaxis protein
LTALGITLKEGETAADSSSIAVRYAVAASEAFANGEKRKGILLSIAAKAAKLLEAIGLGGLIPLEYADAAAKGASAAATWALLAPIGLLLLAIGGLVGVIALVITSFKALSDAYNADAIAAEKAREEAKSLADAYNEVKEKYEELKQTIADYKDAQDAID